MKKPNLKAMLFTQLEPGLAEEGFKLVEATGWFERQRNDMADYYAFEFYKEVRGYRIQPAIHLRSHTMDQIYHKISGVKPKERVYDTAIAFVIWRVFGKEKTYECKLESEDDVKPAAQKLIRVFKKIALPFFDKYTSIADIDRLYNSDPETPNYWMYLVDFWTRIAYATIAAKLAGNPRYQTLVRKYKEALKESDEDWRADQYEKLLKVLEKEGSKS